MNSNVHPLIVALVLLLTTLAIALWMWGNGAATSVGGPAELRTAPDGHLYIQIQNQLLEHDADGVFLQRHDLAKLGVENVFGSIVFFAEGDILIRRGPDPRTLSENLRAYQRKTNEQTLTPLTPNTGLYRCDLDASSCVLFGPEGVDFKAAHSVFIDTRTDEVYISDTTRHLLRKYSAEGEALAGPVGGFKFPNQLLLHKEQLFIANTNFHQIRVVDPATENFGEELRAIDVTPDVATNARQTWPSHFARVGDQWWVNNMRNAMNEGGIYIFDDDWRFIQKVKLPPKADPIALLPLRGEVLVSDWNNDRVYRLSMDGTLLDDFASPGLDMILEESRATRRQFTMYSYSGIVLFAFVLIGLLVRALAAGMSNEPEKNA